jgi:hypothetical protein
MLLSNIKKDKALTHIKEKMIKTFTQEYLSVIETTLVSFKDSFFGKVNSDKKKVKNLKTKMRKLINFSKLQQ